VHAVKEDAADRLHHLEDSATDAHGRPKPAVGGGAVLAVAAVVVVVLWRRRRARRKPWQR
jgi:uncharacterized protein (TIGR03382 family)